MRIAAAFDHAGISLKPVVKEAIQEADCEMLDLGTYNLVPVDYPDFAEKLGRALQEKKAERGILVCGSGVGACIAANKLKGIYAGLCHDTYSAHQGVEHDDMNVLCLGARIIGPELAKEIIAAFLKARFTAEERHLRRVDKVRKLEQTG
jgi:RpiB/LacA/LacB family sugar-phosphate isomerase